ncbi:MAG: efflux RND transporter periplasmic adaptor subunit [Bacteroidota bacterium]
MKKIFFILILFSSIVACKQKLTTEQELASLKKQKIEIESKIKAIEDKMPQKPILGIQKTVQVDSIKLQEFKHFVEVQGTVEADANTWVTSTGGIVTNLYVKEGDVVKAGQILAKTDMSALERGIDEAKNGLALANTVYEKQKKLWDQNIGSEIQYLQAKSNKEAAEKAIIRLQAQLSMSYMKSPINGTIDEIKIRVGEMASPGTPYSGIRVVNTSKLNVTAKIADAYLASIKKGDKVNIVFPDINKTTECELTFIGKVVNPQNRTFPVQAAIVNSGGDFAPNMIAKLLINDETYKDAIVVPSNIIQTNVEGDFLLIAELKDGKYYAKNRMIKVGDSYNGQSLITEGLSKDDLIITFGYSEISEGQLIKF